MLGVVDSYGRFLLVDIGAAGRQSDSALWATSPIRSHLESRDGQLPGLRNLGTVGAVPHVILGDGGFGLSQILMTPFTTQATQQEPGREKYNKKLSRLVCKKLKIMLWKI